MTDQEIDAVINELKAWIKEKGISQADMARILHAQDFTRTAILCPAAGVWEAQHAQRGQSLGFSNESYHK